MAALQKIRSKGAWLIAIIGLGLFAFVAEPLFEAGKTLVGIDNQTLGSVCGKSLDLEEFQNRVNVQTELAKIQKASQGKGSLTDAEQDQIRNQVWQQFEQQTVVEKEAADFGLEVTDQDMQQAITTGSAQCLQQLAAVPFEANGQIIAYPFGNPQTGMINTQGLAEFDKNYEKILSQAAQSGYAETVDRAHKIWEYTKDQLRYELLMQKYGMLLSESFLSNPISAKMDFNDINTKYTADVVAIPYSTISDKDIKVTDEDLKAMYEKLKDSYVVNPMSGQMMPFAKNDVTSAGLQVLDVAVTPSQADKDALMKEVQGYQAQLENSTNPAGVVNGSGTTFKYVDLPMTKDFFKGISDVASSLDSIAEGTVKPAYYNAGDNTVTTFKLISKIQAPDSIQYRMLGAGGKDKKAREASADSIMKALQGGAKFEDLAKKYPSQDSIWLTSSMYEANDIDAENLKFLKELVNAQPGYKVFNQEEGSVVVQILNCKGMKTKYNVAVVKLPLNFSTKTYNDALNKLNKFMGSSQNLAALKKNALKAGYNLQSVPNYGSDNMSIQYGIGGEDAKEAVRWVFEDAKPGEVSKIYECGHGSDHLLVIGVESVNKASYLSWDDAQLKQYLRQFVIREKKAEKILAQAKAVNSIAAAKSQKGAVNEQLSDLTFLGQVAMKQLGVSENHLAGVIARVGAGKFTGAVKGNAGIYFAQVLSKAAGAEKYDEKTFMEQIAQQNMQMTMQGILASLIDKATIKDNRYKVLARRA